MKRIIMLISLALIAVNAAGYGGEAYAFLKNGVGVRATGMGGAFCSIADDASAVFYNPAGLVKIEGLQLVADTYFMNFNRSMNFISASKPFTINKNLYSTGLSWINYSGGSDIEKRTTNSPLPEELLSDGEHIFMLTVATVVSSNVYIGGNIKVLLHSLAGENGTGIGFDAGLLVDITEDISAGLSVLNISAGLNWDGLNYTDTLPYMFNFGLSYSMKNVFEVEKLDILLAADMLYSTFGSFRIKPGIELEANKFFSIRAGYNNGLAAGLGIKLRPSAVFTVMIDYALLTDPVLRDSFNQRVGAVVQYIFPHWDIKSGPQQEGDYSEEPW